MKRGKILRILIVAIVLIPFAIGAWTWRRRVRPGFRPGFHFRVGSRYPRYYPSGASLLETRDALNRCENRVDDRNKEIIELKIENANLKEEGGKCGLRVERENQAAAELEAENKRLQEENRKLKDENRKFKADLTAIK